MSKTDIFSKILSNQNSRCIIIAEIGSAHCGDITKAYELIDAAYESGADCAKFQIIFADEIVHPRTGKIKLPAGDIDIYQSFKKLEKDKDFYQSLKEYTEKKGLNFLASPFGIKSAEILEHLKIDAVKIASPEINHLQLLEKIKSFNKPVILSTGVCRNSDIKKALDICADKSILLHCSTAYPTPETEYNLASIPYLHKKFKVPVGVSDHSKDPVIVPVLSAAIGAVIIEKHICLDNKGKGLDDPIALGTEDFKKMVKAVRANENKSIREVIIELDYPPDLLKKVIGRKYKKMSRSEKANYKTTNRSLLAVCDIKKGETISRNKIAALRSEHNLKPGASPFLLDKIIGRTAKREIKSGEGVFPGMLK